MIEVACVCVGKKYDPALYVDQLYKGVLANVSEPFKFVVITDTPEHPYYNTIPCRTVQAPNWGNLQGPREAWWYKMFMFSPEAGFTDKVFYCDLDVIIQGSIDKFLDYGGNRFAICQDFNRKWVRNYRVSNSSIMRWHAPDYYNIWKEFNNDKDAFIKKFLGDQDFMTHYFAEREELKVWWPERWAMSFKWELYRGGLVKSGTGLDENNNWPASPSMYAVPEQPWVIPDECSIVVFHGDPKPWDTELGKQRIR